MKKLLTLFVLFAVVGITSAQQHLNIGSRFGNHINHITAYIAHDFNPIVQNTVIYDGSQGTIHTVASALVQGLARDFRPISGREHERYQIGVSATSDLKINSWKYVSTAEYSRSFLLTNGQVPQAELFVQLTYQSYIAYYVAGVVGVGLFVEGEQPVYSRNGVSDPTCDLINRQDGILYFQEQYVTRSPRGSLILFFDQAKTEYEKYSLETGDLIESTRPAAIPVTMSIERSSGGLVLVITGGEGRNVDVESSSDLTVWQSITTLFVKTSPVHYPINLEVSASHRFYRARITETQSKR